MAIKIISVFCVWILSAEILASQESELDWTMKMEKLQELAKNHRIQEPLSPQYRTTGTADFDVTFTCNPKPQSVHQLRPQDIDVIGAMGDSLTAANGGEAETIVGVLREYRGMSWFAGGRENASTTLTIPNLFRFFNPKVQGYSQGERFDPDRDWWFNVAVPGARARDMPEQAWTLIDKMKNDERTNFENDWKLVNIFIGGNDLCVLDSSEDSKPERYVEKLQEALDILHENLPRALVNVVEILEIYLLPEVGTGVGSTRVCRLAQTLFCGFIVQAEGDQLEYIKKQNKQYQKLTQNLIYGGRYDTKDDFTVVLQPFFRDTVLPLTKNGSVDSTFFAPDCFHFGAKGHAMGALNLWNNMFEPVGQKSTQWSITDLKSPTEEFPYIYTNLNSDFEWTSGETTTEGTKTTPMKTAPTTKETTTTLTTTSEVPPEKCDHVCLEPEVDDWVIAVMCVLAVAVLCQSFIIYVLSRSKIKAKSMYKEKL